MCIIHNPNVINPNGDHYFDSVNLTYPPAQENSITYETPNVYKLRCFDYTDYPQGVDVGNIIGNSFKVKGLLFQFQCIWTKFSLNNELSLRWYIVETPCNLTSNNTIAPVFNASLWKSAKMTSPENEYRRQRRALKYKIIRRGTFYPPRRLSNALRPADSSLISHDITDTGNTHLGAIVANSNPTSSQTVTVNQVTYGSAPKPVAVSSYHSIYLKWKRGLKIRFKNLAYDDYIPDEGQMCANKNWWLVVHKTGITSDGNPPSGATCRFQLRQQVWYSDDQ